MAQERKLGHTERVCRHRKGGVSAVFEKERGKKARKAWGAGI